MKKFPIALITLALSLNLACLSEEEEPAATTSVSGCEIFTGVCVESSITATAGTPTEQLTACEGGTAHPGGCPGTFASGKVATCITSGNSGTIEYTQTTYITSAYFIDYFVNTLGRGSAAQAACEIAKSQIQGDYGTVCPGATQFTDSAISSVDCSLAL